jgi:hypothetical protein
MSWRGTQAQDSIAQTTAERAEARGRALMNLRLQEAEGGLLGRTLLTLVSNKVCNKILKPYWWLINPAAHLPDNMGGEATLPAGYKTTSLLMAKH